MRCLLRGVYCWLLVLRLLVVVVCCLFVSRLLYVVQWLLFEVCCSMCVVRCCLSFV